MESCWTQLPGREGIWKNVPSLPHPQSILGLVLVLIHRGSADYKKERGKKDKSRSNPKSGHRKGKCTHLQNHSQQEKHHQPYRLHPNTPGAQPLPCIEHLLPPLLPTCLSPGADQGTTHCRSCSSESNLSPTAGGSPCWGEGKRGKKEKKRREDNLLP